MKLLTSKGNTFIERIFPRYDKSRCHSHACYKTGMSTPKINYIRQIVGDDIHIYESSITRYNSGKLTYSEPSTYCRCGVRV